VLVSIRASPLHPTAVETPPLNCRWTHKSAVQPLRASCRCSSMLSSQSTTVRRWQARMQCRPQRARLRPRFRRERKLDGQRSAARAVGGGLFRSMVAAVVLLTAAVPCGQENEMRRFEAAVRSVHRARLCLRLSRTATPHCCCSQGAEFKGSSPFASPSGPDGEHTDHRQLGLGRLRRRARA
jgi:hypothetical protein